MAAARRLERVRASRGLLSVLLHRLRMYVGWYVRVRTLMAEGFKDVCLAVCSEGFWGGRVVVATEDGLAGAWRHGDS